MADRLTCAGITFALWIIHTAVLTRTLYTWYAVALPFFLIRALATAVVISSV